MDEIVNAEDTTKILDHPRSTDIIEILELKCDFILANVTLQLFGYAFDDGNWYFIDHWFSIIRNKKNQPQLIDNMLIEAQKTNALERKITNSNMINVLVNQGWQLPSLEILLTTSVFPVLIKYVIEKQRITVTLNHLQMRMDYITQLLQMIDSEDELSYGWYLDTIHILLTLCDSNLRNNFYENRIEYCNNHKELIAYVELLFEVAFDKYRPLQVNDDDHELNPREESNYKVYFAAMHMKMITDEEFEELWLEMMPRLFYNLIQMKNATYGSNKWCLIQDSFVF